MTTNAASDADARESRADEAAMACGARGQARLQAILLATHDVLAEHGYEQLTIDAVAAKAHASKATIYRRWKDKAELVADAIQQWPGAQLRTPHNETLREDLLEMLDGLSAKLRSKSDKVFVGLIQAAQRDPKLGTLIREQTHCRVREIYAEVIERARQRGEIFAGVDAELIITLAPALLFYRHLITGDGVDKQLCTVIVDDILIPLLSGNPVQRKGKQS
ncbi:MAG: TetR/AcrR family transcriptional regulator [Sciscionella sp.]|nr:TetR/AcrR family transcriptional regulator [Sciscionella sp.]